MSQLKAKVIDIQSEDSLHIIKCSFENTTLRLVTLEINKSLDLNSIITLGIKPTHICVGKNSFDLSIINQISVTIEDISQGKILSHLDLKTESGVHLESIITTDSLINLQLKKDDSIVVYMNPTDISIVGIQ